MQVQPYLFFDGRCEEALEFYRQALKAEVTALMRYKEAPEQSAIPQDGAEKVMHAEFNVGQTKIMASDGKSFDGRPSFQGFALTVQVAGDTEAERVFQALSAGGQVQMPLAPTFFSPRFGMATDRFGVLWMVIV